MYNEYYNNLLSKYTKRNFVLPAFGHLSIAEIMPSILEVLGASSQRAKLSNDYIPRKNFNNVVLIVLDGLGYDYYEQLAKYSKFFKEILDRNKLFALTSVFPSTTPAALTTLYSGLTPQEHGLLEWYTYFEEFQRIIMPMQFRIKWEDEINSLLNSGGNASHLYSHKTSYQLLRDASIESFIVTPAEFVPSVYNDAVMNGAHIYTYENIESMFQVSKKLLTDKRKSLITMYWGGIDSKGHEFGPGSPEYIKAIKHFAETFDRHFYSDGDESSPNLCLLTADHGQIKIDRSKFLYLEDYFDFEKYLYKNQHQETIVPYGSPNDVFLLTQPGKTEELIEILNSGLSKVAEVYRTTDLLSLRYFGLYEPSDIFTRRVGNICIIPYPGNHIWFEYGGSKEYSLKGLHGGLSRSEMLVPLAVSTIK